MMKQLPCSIVKAEGIWTLLSFTTHSRISHSVSHLHAWIATLGLKSPELLDEAVGLEHKACFTKPRCDAVKIFMPRFVSAHFLTSSSLSIDVHVFSSSDNLYTIHKRNSTFLTNFCELIQISIL